MFGRGLTVNIANSYVEGNYWNVVTSFSSPQYGGEQIVVQVNKYQGNIGCVIKRGERGCKPGDIDID